MDPVGEWQRRQATGFHSDWYLRHNQRRQEHLASLGLDLAGKTVLEVGAGFGDHTSFFVDRGCEVTITEARAENLAVIRARYPESEVFALDMDAPGDALEGRSFEVVYCYGLLYHLREPGAAVAWLGEKCSGLLLLETCVSVGAGSEQRPVSEPAESPTQAVHGLGCRPTRAWVLDTLRVVFPYAYAVATQPWHPEFPLDWGKPAGPGMLTRAVFVGSETALDSPVLLEELPAVQRRH